MRISMASVIDQIRALDEQKAKLLDGAKSEALGAAQQAIEALNSLGFNYRLIEGSRRSSGDRKGTRKVSGGPCPICGFKTTPAHDGRAHPAQETKEPFTAAELNERGYERA